VGDPRGEPQARAAAIHNACFCGHFGEVYVILDVLVADRSCTCGQSARRGASSSSSWPPCRSASRWSPSPTPSPPGRYLSLFVGL
jgi:hypothetical protein